MIQRALNASNEIGQGASEMEAAVTCAEVIASGESEEAAVSVAASGNPECKDYVVVLKDLAVKYGGGPGAPRLCQADDAAKKG